MSDCFKYKVDDLIRLVAGDLSEETVCAIRVTRDLDLKDLQDKWTTECILKKGVNFLFHSDAATSFPSWLIQQDYAERVEIHEVNIACDHGAIQILKCKE